MDRDTFERLTAEIRQTSHTIDSLLTTLQQWKDEGVPGDTVVVVCKDVNGDKATPLTRQQGVTAGMYAPQTEWSGEHYMTEDYRRGLPDADAYDPAPQQSIPAAFLWPAN